MDLLTVTLLFAVIAYLLKTGEQRQRITLLSQHLGTFTMQPMMAILTPFKCCVAALICAVVS